MGGAFRGWIAAYLSRVRSTDGTLKPLAKELSRGFGQSPSLADTISPYEKEYGGCEVCFLIKSTAEEEPRMQYRACPTITSFASIRIR